MAHPAERFDVDSATNEEEMRGESVSTDPEVVSVEDPHLDPVIKRQLTEAALDIMRDVLRDTDVVLFASSAMYVQGHAKGIPELQQLPGDLDIAAGSEDAMNTIRERLDNVPGVTFDHGGELRPLGSDGSYTLSGTILMERADEDGANSYFTYPFEVFYRSVVTTPEVFARKEMVSGLPVPNLEGLQSQYLNNIALESKIDRAIEELGHFMHGEPLRIIERADAYPSSAWLMQDVDLIDLLEQLSLPTSSEEAIQKSLRTVQEMFDLMKKMQQSEIDGHARDMLKSMLAKMMGMGKIKLTKRHANVQELRRLQRHEVTTVQE